MFADLIDDLPAPLVSVEILNPYNDKAFFDDKISIVDIKARDTLERFYQIEIQLNVYKYLANRILYNWTDIYNQQLKSGEDYRHLKPSFAIWLLAENLINDDRTIHDFKMRSQQGLVLCEHGGIKLVELKKFSGSQIDNEQQRWIKFFKEGEQLNDESLPSWMQTQEMKQAMNTLSTFSEKQRAEAEKQRAEAALAEIERLKSLLANSSIHK